MSVFDFEAPAKEKKPKASTKTPIGDILKTSGKATANASEVAATEEPAILATIRSALTKAVQRNKIAKRSAIIQMLVTKLFPEMEDDESAGVFGSIQLAIDNMVSEGDIQELKFSDSSGNPIESVLVSGDLSLDMDFGAELEGDEDEDLLQGLSTGTVDLPGLDEADLGDPSSWKDADSQMASSGVNFDPYSPALRGALNAHVQMFSVLKYTEGSNDPDATIHYDAAAALQDYSSHKSNLLTNNAAVYGMIPVEVKVSLDFVTPTSSAEDALDEQRSDDHDGDVSDILDVSSIQGGEAAPSDATIFDQS